jgi:hypothetical protein
MHSNEGNTDSPGPLRERPLIGPSVTELSRHFGHERLGPLDRIRLIAASARADDGERGASRWQERWEIGQMIEAPEGRPSFVSHVLPQLLLRRFER